MHFDANECTVRVPHPVIAVGQRLGEYEIRAQVRAGGMATLFRGHRTGAAGFGRDVAIKVIHPHLATDRTLREMFVHEALLSARIHHPNVVHVEEFGQAGGTYFLVMEYVDGASLADVLVPRVRAGSRLPVEQAVAFAMEIAKGLHAAHEVTDAQGEPMRLVHRDVSPQNVLVSRSGHVKLIDFGIAKADGLGEGTRSGTIRGKLRYMAPEQALRRPLDRRTDVYALGVLLWEMITARRFYEADDEFALLDAVRAPNVVPPSCFVPEVPPALDAVLLRALSYEPDHRFESADAMRRALATACPAARDVDATQFAALVAEATAARETDRTSTLVDAHSSETADAPITAAPGTLSAREKTRGARATVTALGAIALVATAVLALTMRGPFARAPAPAAPTPVTAPAPAPAAPRPLAPPPSSTAQPAPPSPPPAFAAIEPLAPPHALPVHHRARHRDTAPHRAGTPRTVHDVPILQHPSF